MRTVLIPLLLIPFCHSAPLSGYEQTILKLWSNTTDRSETLELMRKEATRIGLNKSEYYRQNFVLSQQEKLDFDLEGDFETLYTIFGDVNSTSEVLDLYRQHYPKSYPIIAKRQSLFERMRGNLDAEAEKFLCDLGQTYLELTLRSAKQFLILAWADFVKTSRKIRSDYSQLPQASKDALERTFCFRTTLKSMEKLEDDVYSQMAPMDLDDPLKDWM